MADGSRSGLGRVVDAEFVETTPAVDEPTPHYDHLAERAVLAAMLLDGGAAERVIPRVAAILTAKDFHDPRHATLWDAFLAVHKRGEALDVLTAVSELRTRNRLNTIGGAQYIGELTDEIPTLAHCETHARLVKECSARRSLTEIGLRLARASSQTTCSATQLRDLAIDTLRKVHVGASSAQLSDASDLLTEMWSRIDGMIAGTHVGPLPFGVSVLDRMSGGGMKRGGAYFIAARPGVGKTAMCCQIGAATAESGERVLYAALEPSRVEVMQSMAANRAGVGLVKIAREARALTQGDMNALVAASNAIAQWPVHAVDMTDRDPPDTVAKIENAMRRLPSMPSLVIVDHLLKLKPTGRYGKPHEGTAEVVADIVALGKRTGATVLTLCHIGRGVSGNGGLFRRPRSEDIAGGDAMNRDADGIIVMHREDKYPTRKDSVDNPMVAGMVDLLAPKLRGVEDNTYGRMRFRGDVQRFEALAGGDGEDFSGGDAE